MQSNKVITSMITKWHGLKIKYKLVAKLSVNLKIYKIAEGGDYEVLGGFCI